MKAYNLNRVILTVIQKQNQPLYALEIRDAVEKHLYAKILIASIYSALIRMEEKGLVRSQLVEGDAKRGGKPRAYYRITEHGIKELNA